MSNEYEIEETSPHPIAQHFMQETTEADLRAIFEMKAEIAAMETILEEKIKAVKAQNKGIENLQRGAYVASLKTVSGRVSCDWKQAYRDAVGEMSETEVSKYVRKSEDTIRLEVRRLDG